MADLPPASGDRRLLPEGIRDARSELLLDLVERLGVIDLAPLLVYRIDQVQEDALPLLAWQFDVVGLKGWALATTPAARRALVARAVELHRYRGTPWAVKEALRSVGHTQPEIEERVPELRYDGRYRHNAAKRYQSGRSWALFRIRLGPLAETAALTRADREAVQGLVDTYKNARSHLRSLIYVLAEVSESAPPAVDLEATGAARRFYRYDGRYRYDAAIGHHASLDTPFTLE